MASFGKDSSGSRAADGGRMSLVYQRCQGCGSLNPDEETVMVIEHRGWWGTGGRMLCRNCVKNNNGGSV